MTSSVLQVEHLCIGLRATPDCLIVRDLSFSVQCGEVLGVVGESGSGKSLTAYAIAGLLAPELGVISGRVLLKGRALDALGAGERRALSGSRIGMVFQDPLSSFNPVRTIGSILIECAMRHRGGSAVQARRHVIEALAAVRLPHPDVMVDAYPHELSGGQRQRAMIALARLNAPALLIADEPTTALDSTVQMQVLALLRRDMGESALLLITHDLGVAAAMCDRIVVMHEGRCVEHGDADDLLSHPQHVYTRRLLDAALALHTVSKVV
ncbi:MAG: ABC transporter ATP-binding protein [Casimicrobiaceae bacterium]